MDMAMYIIFPWGKGSFNDNAVYEFKRRMIPFRFNFGQLEYRSYSGDWFQVDYRKLREDENDNLYVILEKENKKYLEEREKRIKARKEGTRQ